MNDKYDGHGKLVTKNEGKIIEYKGQFKNGLAHGFGKMLIK